MLSGKTFSMAKNSVEKTAVFFALLVHSALAINPVKDKTHESRRCLAIFRGYHWASEFLRSIPGKTYLNAGRVDRFLENILPEVIKQGIAPLAMKTLGGNGQSVKDGLVTPEEALRYTLSLPITTLISGMDTLAWLRQNASAAASFKPYSAEEMAALEKRCSVKHQYEIYRHVAYLDGKPNHARAA